MTPDAPPLTATCRWCDERIEWCDVYGWLLRGWHPSPTSGQCGSKSHAPKEDRS